jgi:hypothetical protein
VALPESDTSKIIMLQTISHTPSFRGLCWNNYFRRTETTSILAVSSPLSAMILLRRITFSFIFIRWSVLMSAFILDKEVISEAILSVMATTNASPLDGSTS